LKIYLKLLEDLNKFYTTSFKDSYRKPEYKPLATYAGAETSNNMFNQYKQNTFNINKIEKDSWFNSSRKKDFSYNDTQNLIINSFNNVKYLLLIYFLILREKFQLQFL